MFMLIQRYIFIYTFISVRVWMGDHHLCILFFLYIFPVTFFSLYFTTHTFPFLIFLPYFSQFFCFLSRLRRKSQYARHRYNSPAMAKIICSKLYISEKRIPGCFMTCLQILYMTKFPSVIRRMSLISFSLFSKCLRK